VMRVRCDRHGAAVSEMQLWQIFSMSSPGLTGDPVRRGRYDANTFNGTEYWMPRLRGA
jgi:hypothetical protein